MEKEIVHLQKQVKELRIALLVTQVLTIVMTIFLGYQCLRSIWNYQYLLQQVSICQRVIQQKIYCKRDCITGGRENGSKRCVSRENRK